MDPLYRIDYRGAPRHALRRHDGWRLLDGDPFGAHTVGAALDTDSPRLLAPVIPSKIVAVGLNYRDPAAEMHKPLPDEPLIFVWVALVSGISDNIQVLLDETAPLGDPESADAAIFYSISNAQKGLNGINFGNFLIKRVVDSLSSELKGLKTFATLSPVPGFRTWLDKALPWTRRASCGQTSMRRARKSRRRGCGVSLAYLVGSTIQAMLPLPAIHCLGYAPTTWPRKSAPAGLPSIRSPIFIFSMVPASRI